MSRNERTEGFERLLLRLDEEGLAFVDAMLDELIMLNKEVSNA